MRPRREDTVYRDTVITVITRVTVSFLFDAWRHCGEAQMFSTGKTAPFIVTH